MSDKLKIALEAAKELVKSIKEDPAKLEELSKALAPAPAAPPSSGGAQKLKQAYKAPAQKGVHLPMAPGGGVGMSQAGFKARSAVGDKDLRGERGKKFQTEMTSQAKAHHQQKLGELKAMPKPNLPKSEIAKEEHQPHPGPSSPEWAKKYNAARQTEDEKKLKEKQSKPQSSEAKPKFSKEMFKSDMDRFGKKELRKDPPSEGTGLPKPDSPHESKKDLKAKIFSKGELQECLKADDQWFKKCKKCNSKTCKCEVK